MPDREPEKTSIGWSVGPRGEVVDIIDAPSLPPPKSRSYGTGGLHFSKRGLALLAIAAVTLILVINNSETTAGSGTANGQSPSTPEPSLPPATALADKVRATRMPTPTLTVGGFVCETTDGSKPDTSKRCSNSLGLTYWQVDALASGPSGDVPASIYLEQATPISPQLFREQFSGSAMLGSLGTTSSGFPRFVRPAGPSTLTPR